MSMSMSSSITYLTEEICYSDMMRRDAYYAERRIRKAREWEIQQQQSQSVNNVGAVLPLPKMGKGAIVVVSANSYITIR